MAKKGLLSAKEIDALMGIFETAGMTTPRPHHRPTGKTAARNIGRTAVKSRFEAAAFSLARYLGESVQRPVRMTLRKIVRPKQPLQGGSCEMYRSAADEAGELWLCCPVPLVNLLNETALGNKQGPFALEHRLSDIDHGVFETASLKLFMTLWHALGIRADSVTTCYTPSVPPLHRPIEARFVLEIVSLPPMNISLFIDESLL